MASAMWRANAGGPTARRARHTLVPVARARLKPTTPVTARAAAEPMSARALGAGTAGISRFAAHSEPPNVDRRAIAAKQEEILASQRRMQDLSIEQLLAEKRFLTRRQQVVYFDLLNRRSGARRSRSDDMEQ